MLNAEAEWIGEQLGKRSSSELSPLLDIGSASAEFRQVVQPYIHSCIFQPLEERGARVIHVDLFPAPGVDLVGDLSDDAFVAGLRGFRSLLCCNLLEHVPDPGTIAAKLQAIVLPGGFLVVTVPYRFPYHPDPIDTMFRPNVGEVAALFPQCRLIAGSLVDCGTGWDYVGKNPFALVRKVARRLANGRHGGVAGSASFGAWLFRRFRQTCVLLQKQ